MNTQEFIAKALEVHSDNSPENYSRAVYVSDKVKVEIICPNCGGTYHRTPETHLRGNACPLCYDPVILRVDETSKLTTYWI